MGTRTPQNCVFEIRKMMIKRNHWILGVPPEISIAKPLAYDLGHFGTTEKSDFTDFCPAWDGEIGRGCVAPLPCQAECHEIVVL